LKLKPKAFIDSQYVSRYKKTIGPNEKAKKTFESAAEIANFTIMQEASSPSNYHSYACTNGKRINNSLNACGKC